MMTTHKKRGRPPKEKKSQPSPKATAGKAESDSPVNPVSGVSNGVKCAFCRGTGFDRFGVPSKLSKCQTCTGRGKVHVPEPYEKCSSCLGTGVYRHHRLTCSVCGGKGQVRALNRTRGKGCEKENEEALDVNTGLPCISAYELGEVEPR